MDKKKILIIAIIVVLLSVGIYYTLFGNPFSSIDKDRFPLMSGSKESDLVKKLQEKLNKKGHGLKVDGDFGPKTEEAVLKELGKKEVTYIDFIKL